jgi:hypothetical protein
MGEPKDFGDLEKCLTENDFEFTGSSRSFSNGTPNSYEREAHDNNAGVRIAVVARKRSRSYKYDLIMYTVPQNENTLHREFAKTSEEAVEAIETYLKKIGSYSSK